MMEMAGGNEMLEDLLVSDLTRVLNALRRGRDDLALEELDRAAQKI